MWGLQFWLNMLILLALGILGVSSVIIKKKPEAKELIDKLAKISGYIGIGAAAWGIYIVISSILNIRYIQLSALGWLTGLAAGVVFVGLGFIFGYGMVTAYLSEEAKAKGEQLRQKLVNYQIPLGWVSLGLFAWLLVFRIFIFRVYIPVGL